MRKAWWYDDKDRGLSLNSCVTSGRLPKFSKLQFPDLQNSDKSSSS